MTTITESIGIDAPPEAVFEYMASPENHVGTSPGLVEVRNVRPLPNGGHEADFTFRLLGRDLDAHSRDLVFDPPRRRVYEFAGDVDGRMTYEFTAAGDGTRFGYVAEFEPPGPGVLRRVTGTVMERYLRRDARATLANAKAAIEAERAETVVAAGAE